MNEANSAQVDHIIFGIALVTSFVGLLILDNVFKAALLALAVYLVLSCAYSVAALIFRLPNLRPFVFLESLIYLLWPW